MMFGSRITSGHLRALIPAGLADLEDSVKTEHQT